MIRPSSRDNPKEAETAAGIRHDTVNKATKLAAQNSRHAQLLEDIFGNEVGHYDPGVRLSAALQRATHLFNYPQSLAAIEREVTIVKNPNTKRVEKRAYLHWLSLFADCCPVSLGQELPDLAYNNCVDGFKELHDTNKNPEEKAEENEWLDKRELFQKLETWLENNKPHPESGVGDGIYVLGNDLSKDKDINHVARSLELAVHEVFSDLKDVLNNDLASHLSNMVSRFSANFTTTSGDKRVEMFRKFHEKATNFVRKYSIPKAQVSESGLYEVKQGESWTGKNVDPFKLLGNIVLRLKERAHADPEIGKMADSYQALVDTTKGLLESAYENADDYYRGLDALSTSAEGALDYKDTPGFMILEKLIDVSGEQDRMDIKFILDYQRLLSQLSPDMKGLSEQTLKLLGMGKLAVSKDKRFGVVYQAIADDLYERIKEYPGNDKIKEDLFNIANPDTG
ncbi:hypothetical protein KY328_00205 [Candidatus Woesearchaeota archaeon]|nr:hypothetical protein [Candidatus Woesearchaeota archaeon]MBW3021320.1 hypothetical protein [Candidatus Woesearchaeota archaeon]